MVESNSVKQSFNIAGKKIIITGGAGLLGIQHAEAISEFGGVPILWDIDLTRANIEASCISKKYGVDALGVQVDITEQESIIRAFDLTLSKFQKIDGLINNAANNPKIESNVDKSWSHFENFDLQTWLSDLAVGLTGAYLCSQTVGTHMAKNNEGVIINISSDLGIIAPDQRIYKKEGLPDNMQPVKPVTYSVVKHGLIGLTKYLSTYWPDKNIRCNALSPGGIESDQSMKFKKKIKKLIPLNRMAYKSEYKSAVKFLCSDASSYMTGQNLIIDGGRSIW